MSPLVATLAAIAEHGPALLLGVTVVLLCGVLAMRLHRSPAHRRHLGIVTALGVLLYLLVGVAPLPRLALRSGEPTFTEQTAPVLDAEARAARLQAAIEGLVEAPVVQGDGQRMPPPAAAPAATQSPAVHAIAPSLWSRVAAWPWRFVFAGAWLLGVVMLLVRTLGGRLRLRALLAACRPVPPALLRGLELPAGARVCSTALAVRPFCAGFWRSFVVLPQELLEPARAAEALAVLRHELAHVRARDGRVWSLLSWLAVPLFFHPLYWWLCREVRFCSELLADDAAARAGGRQRYARALIDLAERGGHQVAAVGTVAVFHRPSEFYRRIQMLLQRQGSLSTCTTRLRRFAQTLSMLCLVGTAASLFGVPAAAQDPDAHPLRQQNAELRATIDLLRTELAEMRGEIQLIRTKQGAAAGNDLFHAAEARSSDPRAPAAEGRWPHFPEGPRGAGPTSEGQPPALPPTGLGGQPPTSGPAGGVPLLPDLPVLGELFHNQGTVTGEMRVDSASIGAISAPAKPYTIKKGDSMERIAKAELGSAARADEIRQLNPGIEPNKVRTGQKILIPAAVDSVATPIAMDTGSGLVLQDNSLAQPKGLAEILGQKGNLAGPVGQKNAEFPSTRLPESPSSSSGGVAALADLTSRYLDLQADLEVQKVTAAETKSLVEAGHAPAHEGLRAAVTLRTLERKLAIAARLIDGEIVATESELQWIGKRRTECSPTEAMQLEVQASRAKTRLEALKAVK